MNQLATLVEVSGTKEVQRDIINAEDDLRHNVERIYVLKWILGQRLTAHKEQVGHGNWMIWLPANFPELGSNCIEQAARAMRFFRDNETAEVLNLGNSRNIKSVVEQFTPDSRRKLMWNYIPAKERPELHGDESVSHKPHYLSFVNHFAKWDRGITLGHIPLPPVTQFRREMESPLKRIIEIGGKDWVKEVLNG